MKKFLLSLFASLGVMFEIYATKFRILQFFDQNTLMFLSKPTGFRDLFVSYFAKLGKPIKIDKSLGGIVRYHRMAVGTATVLNFFKGIPTAVSSNMVGSFIAPQDEHMLVEKLRISHAVNATVDASDWTYGATLAELKNAKFSISQNGVVIERNIPFTVFAPSVTPGQNPYAGFYELKNPIPWAGQESFEINVEANVAFSTANLNLMVEAHGTGFVS